MTNTFNCKFYIIAMILLTGYATNSCNVKKNFEIQKLNNLLEISIDTLRIESKPIIDTIKGMEIPYNGNTEIDICYISDSDCTICIVATVRFLENYLSSKWDRPITIITKGYPELLKYYLDEYGIHQNKILILEATDKACKTKNGAYIIYKNRIIDFIKENKDL